MAHLLLTNDDGYRCSGFSALLKELSSIHQISAVVPDRERSWIGKKISSQARLSTKEVEVSGQTILALDGTPADCVQVGLYHCCSAQPDLVVSGINIGTNAGIGRIFSSGTVGAAIEAALAGRRAVAVSLFLPKWSPIDFFDPSSEPKFAAAAKITSRLLEIISDRQFKNFDVLSINVPEDASLDMPLRVTRPCKVSYGPVFVKSEESYSLKNPPIFVEGSHAESDITAISQGYVAITPISLDLFREEGLEEVRGWFE